MADVEDAHAFTDRRVLAHDAAAGILDGHLPAAEVRHLRAERNVTVVEGGGLEGGVGHVGHRIGKRIVVILSVGDNPFSPDRGPPRRLSPNTKDNNL